MARLLFPADRTAYVYSAPGRAITVPDHVSLQVFLDQACTALADIATPAGVTIANATLYTDDAGLVPEFLGPDGTSRLWAKPVTGAAYPLDANYGDRINAIGAGVGTPVGGSPGAFLRKVSGIDFDTAWGGISVTDVGDSSPIGRSLMTAADLAAARLALGIVVGPVDPSAAWGPAETNFVWIQTP